MKAASGHRDASNVLLAADDFTSEDAKRPPRRERVLDDAPSSANSIVADLQPNRSLVMRSEEMLCEWFMQPRSMQERRVSNDEERLRPAVSSSKRRWRRKLELLAFNRLNGQQVNRYS